ncbi:immunity protein Imm33 domain-containing protein [Faecalibacterium prausnitzii]|uniref:immunity protein Imm33 domain-containing protein n=1 Tax=Faecalibacterium prausnitzii TaxID=853 RepID=UPI003AAE87DC
MGAWGIKALERDEGLDVLDILKNEYVPEHPVMDLGEMIELMKEEVMLGSDFSQIDFLFDNTAMALAELYFQWKDNSKLDYDHEEAIWDKVTGFTASKEALAFLLRQLTDIKNEVPDEDGIREIVDLWKNEDSGEIAPAWLEHLNQLIDRLDSEQEARQMYIKKYWGNFIGGSDDSLNLVAFLEDQKKEEIPLSEIFAKIGLDKQNWDFRQTVEYLEFTHSDGVEMDFHFAIDVVTDLAAILLECSVSGSVNLQDLDEYNTPARRIRITVTPEEHDAMNKALADFAQNPLEYDLSEMMDNEEIQEMARDVEALRKELYEAAGRNRDYHVKAEDVKSLLPDWKGADGCIATNRITVEGRKVGYCYREEPDGGWDSGWRFTAGDESDEYMDDPNNAGIYKLNTICNDDPDIIPLLNTPAPCAFERDENGVFQQIKDWKPDEDEEDPDMDILKQCQKWHEEDKHQKIVDALEAISAEERTPEMDMELARAYNNLADSSEPEGRKLLHQALELMQSHEEELGDTYSWNFRMGYAYYYLDQEGRALRHFEKALELHPGDDPKLNTRQDMEELIDSCKKGISLPQFWECFRERTENWWETFAEMEAELRQMMDEDKDHTRGAELVDQMQETLNLVFDEISFEMGFNGEKYELILTPEGDKVKLFELVYFQKHAPKEMLKHWNILVGRQPLQNIGLRTEDGWEISGEDVQIWLEKQGENSFAISAYCEKLLPMLREAECRVWWMLTTLTDQVLGEIPHMRYIDSFDVLEEPKAEPSFLLSQLPDKLREQGLELSTDPEAYLESYLGYKMEPKQDPDADWRLDVMAGSTCCVPLINGYLNADNDFMDDLHADGAVAGFFCYPLDTLREEEGSQKIFDFRDKLEEVLTGGDGSEVLTLTGGATGLYCGYVDFIAWDIQEALNMAKEFFEGTDIPWAIFHTFRREAGSVSLKQQDDGTETENQDDELDETLTGMDYIPYTQQNAEAFFAQLEQWNDEDEYTRCIQALNAIPENWRNYRTAYALARALENYAIIGDHDEGTLKSKGDKALLRAIEVLESVREEGQNKAQWNMRMAYGYQYLYGQEEKAIPYAQRWAELDPEDENAPAVIRECKAEIRKRQRSRKKKAKFVPGDTPFEGFDLTNFWDDNWYALKEYVSESPSDELIASVEEELGYKLPAAYIWLMKQHNGGIPVNTCYPCDEPTCWADDHVAITGIFGIGREKSCSLCGELGSQFMIDEWEYPAIGVAICDCPSAGHDMIFLDYRVCGPQGEPAVVHVDQENDYKITHLADSFEEFVRGLEHESLYDPDEDVEDLEDDADEEKTDRKGSFAGSVLLSKAEWDKEQLIRNLREEWGIVDEEPDEGDEDEENSDDAVVMRVGGMMLIVTLFHGHIPDNEAEINAENNYMWPEAVEVAKAHKAHIMVAVLGEEEKLLERGKLFTKAMAVCCKQKYATGVYTSGVVFEPRFYEGLADMLKKDELPIFNWVWFGLYRSEGGLNGYTYGMDVFGKEEMEVLNTDAEPEELRDFLASLASYVLACDVTLQDGETIGFSADDKHTITRSPGISLPEEQMTLKIGYEPIKGDPEDDSCDHSDNDDTQDEEEFSNPEVYTEEEMEAVEEHIEQYFGKFENVFHELVSPDIHVDICVVPPSEERDYCTLVTMGMGAHRMNVPEELAEYKLERAELAIALPADWKLDQESMKDEKWYWPIRLLKSLARLPIASDTWLGFGHTMDNKENFAENTKLCAAILTGPQSTEEGGEVCTLPGGEEVNFYQVIPLYEDELDYKLEHDVDALLNKMRGISFVVNPTRQNAITRGTFSNDNFDGEMDDASYHLESIEEKELPIDPINAYNHMAIYLRWCMEHDLMGEDFLKEYSEVAKQVKADPASVDLREFIRDELDGCLFSVLFNQQGRAFAGYYYGEGDSPYYPADIDDYALKYFGPSRYHSNEFQQEAYLFIPFDEKYYQTMAQVIEERFENWQGQDFDEDTLEPSEVAHAIMEYLDCECTYFPSMADDDPIMSAYSYAQRLGVREGFVPVLIQADDETLLECLVMNADPEHDADCYEFDLKTVEEYRKKMLSAPVKDGKAILEELTGQRKEEAEDDDLDWEEEVLGEMEGGEPNDRFANYWNDDTGMTYPLILAKIPVKNPWEIFAYLPFGNWNECPDTPDLMAVAKYWFEQHGAIPAAMSHDELEFELPTPISKERAMEVAVEQYGFCPDLDQNEDGSIGSLADVLWQSTVWYFWWD